MSDVVDLSAFGTIGDLEEEKLIEPGSYGARILSVDTKVGANPAEDGQRYPYLVVEWTLTTGEFAGRRLWQNLSISPKAAGITRGNLERLGLDVSVPLAELIELLPGMEAMVTTRIAPAKGEYEARAEIKKIVGPLE